MWRAKGLVWRVLHRYHTSTPLRLPQNHHVEDEVKNTSTVLSTSRNSSDSSSQKEEDGEHRRKKQRAFKFSSPELPRYTALDAMGWGAAAVLFMQICRRVHSRFSSGTDPSPTLTAPSTLHTCGYRLLLEIISRNDVVPRGNSVLCLHSLSSGESRSSSSSTSDESDGRRQSCSEQNRLTTPTFISDHQGPLGQDFPLEASCPSENVCSQDNTETEHAHDKGMFLGEERLAEAAQNLKKVADTNIPVILNIIGLQRGKSKNYEEAFVCFVAAAEQGYSKAQFNAGVCYEMGKGVSKDKEKASHYYWRAAVGGHTQAQYRCAKLLLASGHQNVEKLNIAISLLEKAAAAGLTKAQTCLASVYTREPVRNGSKSVHYLQMAAKSRDDTALLLLGQCYESGFGVQQNLRTAMELYRRAAQAGNKHAQLLLTSPTETDVLRSIRSSPCFIESELDPKRLLSSLASRVLADADTGPSVTLPFLSHSWSTGSMHVPPSLSSTPLHLHPQSREGTSCQWMVGVG
ncbi:death ligand signal enhancer [Dunckerocampus dactyliophorus]|uniref:death ligand signal enhancer n=1 Tax=Dunckerocampus dactyliophorus TaxID=161453 RepID=UPI002406ED50|nr:death ligand signal enhancer [Dunckerocampus dactyliophorus]